MAAGFSRLSVMSVGASRNFGQACLDDDACISYDFVVGSQADSCKFYSAQRCRRTAQRKPATDTAAPLYKRGATSHSRGGEYSGFYTLSSRGSPSFSTQGEACPSQVEGVRCEPGNDILVYPLSVTSRSMFVCTLHASSPALAEAVASHPTMEFLTVKALRC